MEVKRVREDEETLVVRVGSVRLDLNSALFKQVPVFAVLKARLNEDAILVSGEVLPANNLANEEDLGFAVGSCPHIGAQLLYLVDLLLLHVFKGLLLVLLLDVVVV